MRSPISNPIVVALLLALVVMSWARGADDLFSRTNVDPAFAAGLAQLKQTTGFIEDPPGLSSPDWKPNLQLLVGVKAVEGAKRTIRFVELTTLPPPPTNAAGQPWHPRLRTNHWTWSLTNKAVFISSNYPVRVRVFDESGRMLKGGQTRMAWVAMTNGMLDLCRLSLAADDAERAEPVLTAKKKPVRPPSGKESSAPLPDERLMRATGGGFLWMFDMFCALQTVPTVAEVWAKAQCAIRWPSPWTLVRAPIRGLHIELRPRIEQVTLARAATEGATDPLYSLPVDLQSDQRQLCRVEIIVGPAQGAEILFGGIRTIRAQHPTKPKQEFLTQVLATGRARSP